MVVTRKRQGALLPGLAVVLLSTFAAALPSGDAADCEAGDRLACHRLGKAALWGDAGEVDRVRAWARLQRACELGEAPACDDCAAYEKSRGNLEEQRRFEGQSQQLRSGDAGEPQSTPAPTPVPAAVAPVDAEVDARAARVTLAEAACQAGEIRACYRLGLRAQRDEDPPRALRWLGAACELGEWAACDDAGKSAEAQGNMVAARWFADQSRLARACEVGRPALCEHAAESARSRGNAGAARLYEERARKLRGEAPLAASQAAPGPEEWATFGGAAADEGAPLEQAPAPVAAAPVLPPLSRPQATPSLPDAGRPPSLASAPVGRIEVDDGPGSPTPPPAVVEQKPEPVSELQPEPVIELRPEPVIELRPEPVAPAPPRPSLNQKCLTDAEYERYRSVKAALNDPKAFRPSALWAPPIFMTDAEHSYAWVALLYFQTLNFEEGTRTRLLAPLFVSHCAKDSDTFISPLYSHRIDAEGSARLFFTYFQRRDRLAESDVFFPLAWSLRERASEDAPWVGSGAVLPFAFWKTGLNGDHFLVVPPLFSLRA